MQMLGWSALNDSKERGHFSFGTVANATPRELIIDCTNNIDILSVQVTSTGTLTATITVRASNSYIPGPQDVQFGAPAGAVPVRAGSFVDITARTTGVVNPAGAGGDCIIGISAAAEPSPGHSFIMIRFTQSAGTGLVDMYVSGKVFGK